MVRLLNLVAAIISISSVQAELQLNPTPVEYELEGAKFKQLAFRDGSKNATYQPPHGWDYAGSASQLTLHPPGKPQAEATVTRVPLAEPGGFDDAKVKNLTVAAFGSLPKESSGVNLVSQNKSPIKISGKETFQVVLTYKLLGQTFERSILFLNHEGEQVRFQLIAREPDFKELQRAFQSSLCSWQNL